ncbi:hypothetical protein [Streptomyces sp. NBC_00162]|uniref:hypothetical protein n=1 Tax=Streptomyces sp. NBC_00162 TaxID=2903629 RepID=UPI00214B3A79|nr:hypothetical protein [Streptomyces sp. NBC_00162]UUU40640.1 hypothetical protein JIW86_18520 [Streptomyces sp. NBC_00162]
MAATDPTALFLQVTRFQADGELPGGATGENVERGEKPATTPENVMTKIKFQSVFAPVTASGDNDQLIILRVDNEEVFEGFIHQGGTIDVNVTMPITTLFVELGTRTFDALGHPGEFLNFMHLAAHPPPEEEPVWKVTVFDDGVSETTFRSRVPGHGGKFELSFALPSP